MVAFAFAIKKSLSSFNRETFGRQWVRGPDESFLLQFYLLSHQHFLLGYSSRDAGGCVLLVAELRDVQS